MTWVESWKCLFSYFFVQTERTNINLTAIFASNHFFLREETFFRWPRDGSARASCPWRQARVVGVFFWELPFRELTYPIKNHFWRWFSFSQGGICEFPGEYPNAFKNFLDLRILSWTFSIVLLDPLGNRNLGFVCWSFGWFFLVF